MLQYLARLSTCLLIKPFTPKITNFIKIELRAYEMPIKPSCLLVH